MHATSESTAASKRAAVSPVDGLRREIVDLPLVTRFVNDVQQQAPSAVTSYLSQALQVAAQPSKVRLMPGCGRHLAKRLHHFLLHFLTSDCCTP